MKVLNRQAPKVAGGKIIYQRGDLAVWIDATWGVTEFQVESADDVRLEHSDRDFMFAASELILGGTLALPERGDRITVVQEEHGNNEVYEVLAPAGAQPFRRCDHEGHRLRVHGKRLS